MTNMNSGVQNVGGTMIGNNTANDNAIHIGHTKPNRSVKASDTWHFGVITILPEEMRAVLAVLGLTDDGATGQRFYTGRLDATNVVATQSSAPGNLAVAPAIKNLQDRYDPAVIALVGIAGAIHDQVALDDTIIATRVVYYDSRKLIYRRTLRRMQEFRAPTGIIQSANAFASNGNTTTLPGIGGAAPFRVHHGPVGSGEAVIANPKDAIRRDLARYNDKILAVEMEAGGLAQFCQDTTTASGAPLGWVVIRGISDLADVNKDDRHHTSAAVNAAQTMRHLIPHIRPQL
jgi:adenosylhomocysteine nucleosidase